MEGIIEQHSRFFDHLADLIPLKHFHENDNQHVQVRFMGKRQRAEAMKVIKQQGRHQKRAKLDPDKALTTLQYQKLLLQKGHKPQANGRTEEVAEEAPTTAPGAYTLDHRTGSRQELVERLQERLQQAKKQRETAKQGRPEQSKAASKAKEFRQKMRQQTQTKLQNGGLPDGNSRKAATKKASDAPAKPSTAPQPAVEPQPTFTFGLVDVGDGKTHAAKKSHKKPSTVELLKEAEAKHKMQQAPTAEEQAKAREEAWQAALRRARGEKVLDDPKLLRKTLRKEKQFKKKSSKAWQQRTDHEQEQRQHKQDKRQNNLAARTKTKMDNKKAAREKKLLRPGFEGRRNEFISVKKS